MSDDKRKWVVDLYDDHEYVGTVVVDGLGKHVERSAYYSEVFTLIDVNREQRRASALLDKRERQ